MDPKLIGAFGLLCLCSISSSIAASMGGGEETPAPTAAGADAGAGADADKKNWRGTDVEAEELRGRCIGDGGDSAQTSMRCACSEIMTHSVSPPASLGQ